MNLVFHQLKKDLLRTRMLLGLWLVLVVFQFAMVGWNVKPGDTLMQSLVQTLSVSLTLFNYVLMLVLVPLVVHQEPLVGTTAFWFTRPLARSKVLASKVYFVLLLVAVPILAQSIVLLANGVTLHDVILAAPEIFIDEFAWILTVATLAVLTPNFARFATIGATILIVWFLGAIFLQTMMAMMGDTFASISTRPSLSASRGLVSNLIILGFGCTVVVLQYLTRRFALAVALAVSCVACSVLAGYVWPWNFLKPPLQLVQDTGFAVDSVSAGLTSSVNTNDQPTLRGGTPLKQVQGSVTFKNSPKGYIVKIDSIDSLLKSADGGNIPLQPADQPNVTVGVLDPDAVELGLGGVPVLNMDNFGLNSSPLFNLDAKIYNRYSATPLDYSARLNCIAYKYVVATELPLTKGAHFDRDSEHLTITDVLNEPNGVDILLRQKNVHLLFAPRGMDISPYEQDRSDVVYLLLNKVRHEAVIQKRDYSYSFDQSAGILSNKPLQISFGPENSRPDNWLGPQLDQAWLADAVLVRLDLVPVAAFTRTLEVPGFRLDGKFNLPRDRSPGRVADLETLDQITLPHDATRDQVRNYITDILTASRRIDGHNEHDPQIGMLEKVGTENVDLLIQMAQSNHDYYLNHAIDALAQPDHKGMVIEALATNHDLIDTVVDHGWQKDAKPVLLMAFADINKGDSDTSMMTTATSTLIGGTTITTTDFAALSRSINRNYPSEWFVAIASLQDPSTYDSLKAYYIENPNGDLLKALRSLPNFDLVGTFDLAWKKAHSGQPWQVRDLLQPAAQFGEPDVIEVAINLLKRSDNYTKQRARNMLKQYTPATGATDADLIAWYQGNKANLIFDHQAGKFVLRSPTTPPPTTPPTPPKTGT